MGAEAAAGQFRAYLHDAGKAALMDRLTTLMQKFTGNPGGITLNERTEFVDLLKQRAAELSVAPTMTQELNDEIRGLADAFKAVNALADDPAMVDAVDTLVASVESLVRRRPLPSRPTPAEAARHIPAARRPQPSADAPGSPTSVRQRLVAAGSREEISSFDDLVGRIAETLGGTIGGAMQRRVPRTIVASVLTEYPEERILVSGNDTENMRRIDAITSPSALTASSGICAPVAVDYSMLNLASADRPIKNGLPAFQADRGGIVYVSPANIDSFASATSLWSAATDADPGETTKDTLRITCGGTNTVYVDAIPTRLIVGNFQARFFPEQIADATAKALAAAARKAETLAWDRMRAASTVVTQAQFLGAARDMLATLDLSNAAYRDITRMPSNGRVRVLIHRLWRDAIRADMAREIGHAQTDTVNSLAVTDEQIDAWFAARNIAPIWAMDSLSAGTYSGVAVPSQSFAAQSAGSALTAWPTKCAFTMYGEGSYQFLDGGRLDLGVVRDSTLDDTNDYETFVEPFESVAYRGYQSYTVVATVKPNGATDGTVTPSSYPAGT